ncbi:MAG: hypothetical protein AAF503_11620, partial [Pseudomonadota bacterium]
TGQACRTTGKSVFGAGITRPRTKLLPEKSQNRLRRLIGDQQQLGTQALSIANQAPQSILALFR